MSREQNKSKSMPFKHKRNVMASRKYAYKKEWELSFSKELLVIKLIQNFMFTHSHYTSYKIGKNLQSGTNVGL